MPHPLRHVLVNILEVPLPNFLKQLVLVFGPKRIIPLQHHKQKHPQRPHIRIHRHVIPFRHDLRSHISGSSAKSIDGAGRSRLQTKTEIDQFNLLVSIQQNVFSLDIPMHNIPSVQVPQSLRNRSEKLLHLNLRQTVLRFRQQIVVEGIGTAVLLNQKYLRTGLDHID
jgi:hypothetical protein